MARDQEVLGVVRAHGSDYIWHYTRCSALPGIIEHGAILCRAELDRRGVPCESTHYYGTERHREVLGEYVSCAPLPPWGMMRSEMHEIAVLRVDAAAMAIPGTCFCPGWSPRDEYDPDEVVKWTGAEQLEELYTGSGPLMVVPSEIFVPLEIPVSEVQAITFFDEATLRNARGPLTRAAQNLEEKFDHTIKISIEPGRFPRSWQQTGPPWEGQDAPTV